MLGNQRLGGGEARHLQRPPYLPTRSTSVIPQARRCSAFGSPVEVGQADKRRSRRPHLWPLERISDNSNRSSSIGCTPNSWTGPSRGPNLIQICVADACQTCVKRTTPHETTLSTRTRREERRIGADFGGSRPIVIDDAQRPSGLITRRSQVQILPPLRRKPLAVLHLLGVFSRVGVVGGFMSNLCQTLRRSGQLHRCGWWVCGRGPGRCLGWVCRRCRR